MIKCRCGRVLIEGLEVVYHIKDGKVIVNQLFDALDDLLNQWGDEIIPYDTWRLPSLKHTDQIWWVNLRGTARGKSGTEYAYCYRISKDIDPTGEREVKDYYECIIFRFPKEKGADFVGIKDLDTFIEQLY